MSRAPDPSSVQATVLNIQRMSTEDGPGIRTTVFFKGCTLACDWCHNPESIDGRPELVWHGERCIGCGACEEECADLAISRGTAGVEIDREACERCGSCADECPAVALELLGQRWSLADLVREVEKDRPYFNRSGGGVTASGGEPAVQSAFVARFLAECRAEGLHTVLDTCGMGTAEGLLDMARQADLVLYDLKLLDTGAHERHTGHGNRRVLDNLEALAQDLQRAERAAELWIRTPLIPGATATDDNVAGIGGWLTERLGDRVARWELCAFNNLCQHKYERMDRAWPYADQPLLSQVELDRLEGIAREAGPSGAEIQVTGMARRES